MKALNKAFTLIMILALSVAVLTACNNTPVDPPAVNNPTDTAPGTSAENPTDAASDPEITEEEGVMNSEDPAVKELAFVYKDSKIGISDPAEDEKLESLLGKAEEISSHTYTNDDGLNMDPLIGFTEKLYKFPGLEIRAIKTPEEQIFHIFDIRITNSRYASSRGIKVGDSVEKLKETYPEGKMLGDGAPGAEDDFQYLPVDYVNGMKFHVKNDKVESIMMYKLLY